MTRRKYLEIKSKKEFKLAFKKRGWYVNKAYLNQLYSKYKHKEGFRMHLNRYFIKGNKIIHENLAEFKQFFIDVVEHGENFIIEIIGMIRSGKSRVARKIIHNFCTILKSNPQYFMDIRNLEESKQFTMNELYKLFLKIYTTYNFSQSQMVLSIMEMLQICFQDEMPQAQGDGSRNIKYQLTNALKVASGKKRLNFIFLNPDLIIMDNIHWYIQILGINKKQKRTLAIISTNGEKGMEYAGVVIFNVDEPKELTIYYEDTSDKMKEEMKESGGALGVEWFGKEEDLDNLRKVLKECGQKITSKTAIEAFIFDNKDYFMNPIFKKKAVSLIYQEIKNDPNFYGDNQEAKVKDVLEDIEIDFDKDFEITVEKEKEFLEKYPMDYTNAQRDKDLYINYIENIRDNPYISAKQDKMVQKHKKETGEDLSQSTISRALNKVSQWLNDKIGIKYEVHFKARLEKKFNDKIKVVLDENGKEQKQIFNAPYGSNDPDITIYFKDNSVNVYSVKCFNPEPNRPGESFTTLKNKKGEKGELFPEIDFSQKLKRQFPDRVIRCYLHVYDRSRKRSIQKKITFMNPPKTMHVDYMDGDGK